MFTLTGTGKTHTCNGVTRRDFMQVGTLGAIGLTLPQYLAAKEAGAVKKGGDRACIMIFNLGAPSQLDTFDMKPEAPAEIRGPFQAIETAAPGMQISEILPLHAKVADKFSLVRSAHHGGAAVHDSGWQMMQTGRQFTGGVNTPHAGAVVSYLRGRKTDLPPFVVLPELMGRGGGNLPNGQAGGFLGKAHDPFALMADPSKPDFKVPDLLPPPDIGTVRLERRRKMREVVDETVRSFEATESAALLDSNFQAAFRMMTSTQAREAFDLTKEPQEVRDRYGMTRFGQCCLLARRLIEAGVRFVTINTFLTVFDEITWDIHGSKPFSPISCYRDLVGPMFDMAYSSLLEELSERGLLKNTMVVGFGEFGRTPKVNPAGGRDHWPQCWTILMGGGPLKGGTIVGASDEIGGAPKDRPTTPAEVAATIYKGLGIDLHLELPGAQGRPIPIVDRGVEPISELFA
jgi:hypothetical protein